MTRITLYGQHTSTYEYLKMMLKRKLAKAGIEIEIDEVNDWKKIMTEKIDSLPAVKFNNQANIYFNQSRNTNDFLNEVTGKILKEENYGKMIKLVVPTDFSETSTNALVYGFNLAKELNGVIKLVHIYKPAVTQVENVVIVDEEVEKVKRQQFQKYISQINQSWVGTTSDFMPVDGEFKVGFVVDEIRSLCKESDGRQFVILGSTGASDQLKKLFGSVTTQLAKKCNCPVLIIPPKAVFNKIDNILYAIDNIDLDLDLGACGKILEFAKTLNSKVHLVHVKNESDIYPSEKILEACKKMQKDVKVVYREIESQDVAQALNDYAENENIDMISLTSTSRGFIGDLFHKSITRKMAIHTNIPLLIMH